MAKQTILEFFEEIGAGENNSKDFNFRTAYTLYDKDVEFSVNFVSTQPIANEIISGNSNEFEVYVWGKCRDTYTRLYGTLFTGMVVRTADEARTVIELIKRGVSLSCLK